MLNLKSIIENDISLEEKVDQIRLLFNQSYSEQQAMSCQLIERLNNHEQIINSIVSEMKSNYNAFYAYVQEFASRLKERDELINKLNKYITDHIKDAA